MKHTPGPWAFFEDDTLLIGHVKNGNMIARINWFKKFSFQKKANAKLVAAAPELLNELELIVAGWELRRKADDQPGCIGLDLWEQERLEFAQEIITKATK